MFQRFVLFRGGTLFSSACVAASTVGQVLGYKLQLDQALETLEAKHCFLLLHEWQDEIWGWWNYFLIEEETPANQLWHMILFQICRRVWIVLFLNAEQTQISKSAPPIDSVPQRAWCFCLFSELFWQLLWHFAFCKHVELSPITPFSLQTSF